LFYISFAAQVSPLWLNIPNQIHTCVIYIILLATYSYLLPMRGIENGLSRATCMCR